jgi:hypothetical protein
VKLRFWDVLSILGLLGICLQGVIFLTIFNSPDSLLNPFPPQSLPDAVQIPTATATHAQLPPTWTHTPGPDEIATNTLAPSQTVLPTATGFQLPTYTYSPTHTFTPSDTPTITITFTPSKTPTRTNTPKPSSTFTETIEATIP